MSTIYTLLLKNVYVRHPPHAKVVRMHTRVKHSRCYSQPGRADSAGVQTSSVLNQYENIVSFIVSATGPK